MIKELDSVVLTRDVPEHGLKEGDVGAVVHRYGEGEGFEVEFVSASGDTVAVLTLTADDNALTLRPLRGPALRDIPPSAFVPRLRQVH